MADEHEIPEALLSEIRRAAFDLRRTDPKEAVKVLRRAAEQGGAAEVLARGALGEIYLEEFGDLDGAEHEFRAVLEAAPGLPAAELGLARVLHEQGQLGEADDALTRALAGFSKDAATLRAQQERGEPLPEGAEEAALALLEVAVELADLRHERGRNGSVSVPLDEALVAWAQKARLFDPEPALEPGEESGLPLGAGAEVTHDPDEVQPDDKEDWIRFHALWARLRVLTGRAAEAARVLAEAEALGQLPSADAARLRSEVLEESGDLAGAVGEAKRLLEVELAAGNAWHPDDISHAAGLLQQQADEQGARAVLQAALDQAQELLTDVEGEDRQALEDAAKGYREALGAAATVQLGAKK